MTEARFEPDDAYRPMRILCNYCGFASSSMVDALRHDALRPNSCDRWRQMQKTAPLPHGPERIEAILRHMTLQDGGSLELALDRYLEKIEPVYR
jgi:hypothetical protein